MPRLARPDEVTGELRVLNDALHELHEHAGLPSLSDMERMVGMGVASRSRIHEAFSQPRLPSWGLIELLVEQLVDKVPKGPAALDEVSRFHRLWLAASKRLPQARNVDDQISHPVRGPAVLGMLGGTVTALAFNRIGWMYSEQPYDYGIDGIARAVDQHGRVTGKLIAVVTKCGPGYFKQRRGKEIIVREKSRHVSHWLDHQIPVICVLVEPVAEVAYWTHVSAEAITCSADFCQLAVPEDQILDRNSAAALMSLTMRGSSG